MGRGALAKCPLCNPPELKLCNRHREIISTSQEYVSPHCVGQMPKSIANHEGLKNTTYLCVNAVLQFSL